MARNPCAKGSEYWALPAPSKAPTRGVRHGTSAHAVYLSTNTQERMHVPAQEHTHVPHRSTGMCPYGNTLVPCRSTHMCPHKNTHVPAQEHTRVPMQQHTCTTWGHTYLHRNTHMRTCAHAFLDQKGAGQGDSEHKQERFVPRSLCFVWPPPPLPLLFWCLVEGNVL